MCNWPFCNKKTEVADVDSTQWGLSQKMCSYALKYAKALICGKANALMNDTDYLDDYVRIFALMEDEPTVKNCLKKLDDEITDNLKGAAPQVKWCRLSSILGYYERKCGFPEDVLLPMGILSEADFYFYIRLGYVLKDYGAGVKHGEFTHRLQWHVIMRLATDNFTCPLRGGWNCTPFQLYTRLGRNDAKGVWAFLIDRQGVGQIGHHPDVFHALTLDLNGKLAGMLQKRATKRRIEFVHDVAEYLEQLKQSKGVTITIPNEFAVSLPGLSSHSEFLKFDAWLQESLEADKSAIGLGPAAAYAEIAGKGVPAYRARKEAKIDTLSKKPQNRTVPYVKLSQGAVYNLSGKSIWSELDADNRAKESKAKLF